MSKEKRAIELVPALLKMDRILIYLESKAEGAKLSQISSDLQLPKTSVYRIVHTLLHLGYLGIKDGTGNSERYGLGERFSQMSGQKHESEIIREKATPYLYQLSKTVGETIKLSILRHHSVHVLCQIEGPGITKIVMDTTLEYPLHAGGASKLLLAYLSEKETELVLEQERQAFTPHTITSIEALKSTLKQIRRDGFALDLEEVSEGVKALAFPVRDSKGRVIAAISVPFFSVKNLESNETFCKKVQSCAKTLSRAFGYVG